jgi:hypothetical protein
MICTGHQPNYLPYPGFFHKIARADCFVLVDTTQFVKRGPFGWIHRNRIRTPAGWEWLSVPALTKGRFTQSIRETQIDAGRDWARKHARALEWNYGRAPHYGRYAGFFREAYARPWSSLSDLNEHLIRGLLEILGLRVRFERASDLGAAGAATDLVVDLCRRVGADTYLSGIHGRDYLEADRLKAAGIRLLYQAYQCPVYPQCQPGPFVPDLSVVDLLFNCGEQSRDLLLQAGGTEPAG